MSNVSRHTRRIMERKKSPPGDSALPEQDSGVRKLIADAQGKQHRSLPSLQEAREHEGAVVILEGDFGGQIYVVAPAHFVTCTDEALRQLLSDLDSLEWAEPEGAAVYFEVLPRGSGVAGGMGGASVTNGVWVHARLKPHESAICAVLAGERARVHQ